MVAVLVCSTDVCSDIPCELQTVHDRVQKLIRDGASKQEVVAAKPTRDLDAEWGGGFMKPDRWVGIVYDGMVK